MKYVLAAMAGTASLALGACAGAATVQNPVGAPAPSSTSPSSDLAAFPQAARGQTRHVINLLQLEGEDQIKVELIVGKTQTVDCNNHSFGGQLAERTAQGWGYTYYVLDQLGQGVSTMMGCPAGSERQAFVRSSQDLLVRYNSKLPLVVYTPADVEVRYRLWRGGDMQVVR